MYEIYCKLRDEKGLKDSDVAKQTGITKSTFTDWKSGRSIPGTEKMIKLAAFLDVSVEFLKTGKEKEKPEIPQLFQEQFELLELYSNIKEEQKKAILNLLRSMQ